MKCNPAPDLTRPLAALAKHSITVEPLDLVLYRQVSGD